MQKLEHLHIGSRAMKRDSSAMFSSSERDGLAETILSCLREPALELTPNRLMVKAIRLASISAEQGFVAVAERTCTEG